MKQHDLILNLVVQQTQHPYQQQYGRQLTTILRIRGQAGMVATALQHDATSLSCTRYCLSHPPYYLLTRHSSIPCPFSPATHAHHSVRHAHHTTAPTLHTTHNAAYARGVHPIISSLTTHARRLSIGGSSSTSPAHHSSLLPEHSPVPLCASRTTDDATHHTTTTAYLCLRVRG
jgi:hypothetical protein